MTYTTDICRIRIIRSASFLPALLVLLAGATALAQSPVYKMGRTPTEAEVHAWDNVVGSEGKELPVGSGTAQQGAPIFATKCAPCHGKEGQGGVPVELGFTMASLVGGVGTLTSPNPKFTVGSRMPYATTIWDYIERAMPRNAEGTLTSDEIYALTAFLLYKNGIIKETDVMNKASLVEVQMPNRHGFYPDPPQSEPNDKDGTWLPLWEHGPNWKSTTKSGDRYYGPPVPNPAAK
jgi:mono/diheme cytochrome c family protein